MTQKFSPSAFHHGSVQGCLSARADLVIQKILLAHKIGILAWAAVPTGRKLRHNSCYTVLSVYAYRPTKMCGMWELRPGLPDGGDFHRSSEKSRFCQCR